MSKNTNFCKPLKCPECDGFLKLEYHTFNSITSSYKFAFNNSVFFHCSNCDYLSLTQECKEVIDIFISLLYNKDHINSAEVDFKDNFLNMPPIRNAIQNFIDKNETVKFEYDPLDYFMIPGLVREFNIGYLTPVFFNYDVLNKYIDNPKYTTNYTSNNTIVDIRGDNLSITLGINNKKNIIAWLGDLYLMPLSEQKYFLSENIPSDHDLASEFYDSHICVEWPELSNEQYIIENILELNNLIPSFPLFLIEEKDTSTFLADIHPPKYNTAKDFLNITVQLNKYITENINVKNIKYYLKKNYSDTLPKDFSSYGSMKTIVLFFQILANKNNIDIDISKLLSPLFVLYDFRSLGSHKADESYVIKFSSCMERLNINKSDFDNYLYIYNILIERLSEMFLVLKENFINHPISIDQ